MELRSYLLELIKIRYPSKTNKTKLTRKELDLLSGCQTSEQCHGFTVAPNLHVRHKNRDLQFVENVSFHPRRGNKKKNRHEDSTLQNKTTGNKI